MLLFDRLPATGESVLVRFRTQVRLGKAMEFHRGAGEAFAVDFASIGIQHTSDDGLLMYVQADKPCAALERFGRAEEVKRGRD
jgi:hypothetical protein